MLSDPFCFPQYSFSNDFIPIRRIKSEYKAESNSGDDSHTSDESEESGDGDGDGTDDDDEDDEDGDDEEDDNIPDVKEAPPDATPMDASPSSNPDDQKPAVKEEEEQMITDDGRKRRGYTALAIKDVAPVICFDVNAPRQLRPRLKLKLKPLKQEAVVSFEFVIISKCYK